MTRSGPDVSGRSGERNTATRFESVQRPSGSEVTVGALTADGGLEILHGLSDGDRVVTAGVSRIQDGMQIRLDSIGD